MRVGCGDGWGKRNGGGKWRKLSLNNNQSINQSINEKKKKFGQSLYIEFRGPNTHPQLSQF